MSDQIRAFFEAHEHNSATGDIDRLVAQYADSFLAADANGARVVPTGALGAALPKRKQLLTAAGCKAARLVSLEETPLDDHYIMVKTWWRWEFEAAEWPEITLSSTFIVRKTGQELKIVFYLNHEDIMTELRKRGLLPQAPP